LELAAKIAINELVKSKFKETIMCVVDETTKTVYQRAYDRFR